MRFSKMYFLLIFIALAACGQKPDSESHKEELIQSGSASWYGPGFHGKLTSSREPFDQNKFTAAHRTLPFNTIIKVVNSKNDRSVEVRINDRGPYEDDRIIDLSRAAAEEIDMLTSGITDVELFLVEAGGPIPENLNQPTFTIQMGEYNRLEPAERFAESFGEGVRIEQRFPRGSDNVVYMIYYGNYNSFSDAQDQLQEFEIIGLNGLIKQLD